MTTCEKRSSVWLSPQPEPSRYTFSFSVFTADKQQHLKCVPLIWMDMAVYFLHFVYLFIYLFHKKNSWVCIRKCLRHRFCGVGGKEEVAVAELLLVRANHELYIAPSSTCNRAENLKEGELDLQKAYSAKSSSPPRPHQVFFSRINKIPRFSQSSLAPAGRRLTLCCDKRCA